MKVRYGIGFVNPRAVGKIEFEPLTMRQKFGAFIEDLKLFGLYFLIFFFFSLSITFLSMVGR